MCVILASRRYKKFIKYDIWIVEELVHIEFGSACIIGLNN